MCACAYKETDRQSEKAGPRDRKGKESKSEHITHATGHCLWDPGTRGLGPRSIEDVTLLPRFSERV